YLAFVEAMRSYVLSRETRDLRRELGTGAADVARIVSEVREKLKVEPRPPESPEEERYRLFQAVTSFLTSAARVQPLLIILEDLHDSDKGTLDMLTHISRNLSGARLLIVGTYRDVEVDRTHPLSAALAELRRVATFDRVLLRGLNADEVRRMLESITREEVPWSLAEAVHRQTEGNPLFVQEVVRYIVEEQLLYREKGKWIITRDKPLEMSIPEGLRDVVGKRLSSLSPECNSLLSIAAVIGREFRLAVLQKVADVSDDALFAALEEAKGVAVVEERSAVGAAVTYRFSHAFFRQTLYEEIIAPRRIRLHQQVGKALEEIYARRLEEHAAELVEHFSYSPDAEGLTKSVSYGEMAAERASSVYAYGEAVRLLEQALKVQEVLNPDDKAKRCDLLLTLCETQTVAGNPREAVEKTAPLALSLAEVEENDRRAAAACWLAMDALNYYRAAPVMSTPEYEQWAQRLDRYSQPETRERALADVILGGPMRSQDPVAGRQRIDSAYNLARRLGDPTTYWLVTYWWLWRSRAPQHNEERFRIAEELLQSPPGNLAPSWLCAAWVLISSEFLVFGQRNRAEEVWRRIEELAEHTGQVHALLITMFTKGNLAAMDGDLQETVQIARRMISFSDEAGIPEFALAYVPQAVLRPRSYLADADRVLERYARPETYPSSIDYTLLTYSLAHLIRVSEAAEILDQYVVKRPTIGTPDDEAVMSSDIYFLEAATLIGHRPAAELLLNRLAGCSRRTTGISGITCIGRHLGAAAVLLSRPEEARKYYADALEVATDMRFRPEIALTRLQLAELLLEHYPDEKKEALEHLDFAINEFREMKMQPSLERALRHKEILGA
ncbi:MAG: hypothetical protein JSV77_10200, partial [Dehalococcoidales bacterium]